MGEPPSAADIASPRRRSTLSVCVEALAVALTLACVWLTGEEHILCWPVGIAGGALYLWIFFRARLYSDVLLQAYFIVMSAIGWAQWTGGGGDGAVLRVSRLSTGAAIVWAAVAVAGTAILGEIMKRYTRAALPRWDAAIAVLSVIAQAFLAWKVLESWVLWIAVDGIAVGVYAARRLWLTSALYVVLLALATRGLIEWIG